MKAGNFWRNTMTSMNEEIVNALLVTQFSFYPTKNELTTEQTISKVLPTKTPTIDTLPSFLEHFTEEHGKEIQNLLSPETNINSGIFSFYNDLTQKENMPSCTIFIKIVANKSKDLVKGVIQNISPMMPEGYHFQEIQKLMEEIPNTRKITHDMNNQFQIISGFGSALEDEVTDPELKECATNVMNAIMKSIDLNKDFRKIFPPKSKPTLFLGSEKNDTTPENANNASQENVPRPGIIVIDDEPLVQRFLCEMLKRLKYSPTGCSNGQEAIEQVKKNGEKNEMVIMDLNLPDVTSEELFNEIRTNQPHLKIILISGDPIGEVSQRMLNNGANGFLQKPTTVKNLSETIQKVLAE
jgi:CheY-like chemotaxis protein